MEITYLHHSGFVVEQKNTVLVFDYYTENGQYDNFDPYDLKYKGKKIFFFVSHAHSDHYDQKILTFSNRVNYIVFNEIIHCHGAKTLKVIANRMYQYESLLIYTFRSTDEGVAFLVKSEDQTIFHAGDLNWWHWEGESDYANKKMEHAYQREIDELYRLLNGIALDVAMIPVDGRLGASFSWAYDYFVHKISVRIVFPMHFWGHFPICGILKDMHPHENIAIISHENETFSL